MSDPLELIETFAHHGKSLGFHVESLGNIDQYPLIALSRYQSSKEPHLYLSSGIHGDEPAGPLALESLLRDHSELLPPNVTICPLLNPTGFSRNVRENAQGIDLNRDFQFLQSKEVSLLRQYIDRMPAPNLSLCVHEDWESTGFYLYHLAPAGRSSEPAAIIEAVKQQGPIDLAGEIDGHSANGGIIIPDDETRFQERQDWPEAFYLYQKSPHNHYTFETASSLPLQLRIEQHLAAIGASIALNFRS